MCLGSTRAISWWAGSSRLCSTPQWTSSSHAAASPGALLRQQRGGLGAGAQTFSVPAPAWVKFLQLRFLTHYGGEPVCALNELSVFGKSAVEDLEVRGGNRAAAETRRGRPRLAACRTRECQGGARGARAAACKGLIGLQGG